MLIAHVADVALHITAGVLALLIGLVPLVTRKGGRTHRRFGRLFVVVGGVVLASAVVSDVLFSPPIALVGATLAAGYGYLSSLRALALRTHGPGRVDAALAIAALLACAAVYALMGPGTRSWSPAIGYSTIGYVVTLAVYDLSRHAWSQTWLRRARPLDHGLKMTGAYFSMMSAGVGNTLRGFQPYSQIGPSALGLVVMAILAVVYVRRHRKSEAAPLQRPTPAGSPHG
jgi:hypothetical protein